MKNKLESLGMGFAFLILVLMMLPRVLAPAGYSLFGSGVAVAPLLGLVIFVVLIARYESGWAILLMLYAMDVSLPVKGIIAPALNLFYGFAIVTHIIWQVQSRSKFFQKEMLDTFLVGYIMIAACRYLVDPALPSFGVSEGTGFRGYFLFFTSLLPFVILPRMISKQALERTPYMLLLISLIAITVRLIIFFAAPEIFASYFDGSYAVAPSTVRYVLMNKAATVLAISSVAILFYGKPSLPMRWVCMGATGLGLVGLFLSGTRALTLSVLMALLFQLVCARKWMLAASLSIVAAVLIAIAHTVTPSSSGPVAAIIRAFSIGGLASHGYTGESYLTGETVEWRVSLWSLCIDSIKQYPWLGRGLSAEYVEAMLSPTVLFSPSSKYAYLAKQALLDSGGSHNAWLGPFVTFGIPAGFLYFIYVVRRFKKLITASLKHTFPSNLTVIGSILASWAVFQSVKSLTEGGTVAIEVMLLCAISHTLELHGWKTGKASAPAMAGPDPTSCTEAEPVADSTDSVS